MNRAIPYIVCAARIALGGIFIASGVLQAHDGPASDASTVAAYRILPAFAAGPIGIVLPYFEILLGGYLLVGFYARAAAYVATGLLGVYAVAVASLVIRKIPANCGCFGSSVPLPPTWGHVAGDLALVVLAFALARFAPGAFALDNAGTAPLPNGSAESGGEPTSA